MSRLPLVRALRQELGEAGLADLEVASIRTRPVPARLARALAADTSLTPRQREVMVLLASGCSRREIAAELGISVHTVKRHLEFLYLRLGVHDRVEAINAFIEGAA